MIDATRAELLKALAEFGDLAPDMRFGQMIANLVTMAKEPGTQTEWAEAVWDIEDPELLDQVIHATSAWTESLDNPEPKATMPMELPTGEGRTPENVRRTWLMLVESMLGFAEENASVLRADRDREAIIALRHAIRHPDAVSPTRSQTSIAS